MTKARIPKHIQAMKMILFWCGMDTFCRDRLFKQGLTCKGCPFFAFKTCAKFSTDLVLRTYARELDNYIHKHPDDPLMEWVKEATHILIEWYHMRCICMNRSECEGCAFQGTTICKSWTTQTVMIHSAVKIKEGMREHLANHN